jgi:hypothetical protein
MQLGANSLRGYDRDRLKMIGEGFKKEMAGKAWSGISLNHHDIARGLPPIIFPTQPHNPML